MSSSPYAVRAIDVGYGHVKYSDGRDAKLIRVDSFPSQSPVSPKKLAAGNVMHQRDTFSITIGSRTFEVGKGVALAGANHQESEVLDQDFSMSDSYAARLYGALNYMRQGLLGAGRDSIPRIDSLILGLPLTSFERHAKALEEKFAKSHVINTNGDQIEIVSVTVFPQPLGAYSAYVAEHAGSRNGKRPVTALVVDPGYNTVDWFVCQGMTAP